MAGFSFLTKEISEAIFNQLKHKVHPHTKFWCGGKKKAKELQVGINYTDNIDLAYTLKEKVEQKLSARVVFISFVPPIVGANSGPGTLIAGWQLI